MGGVQVLGPLQVGEGEVRLGSRDRTVLAVLAVRPGAGWTQEQLADAVWGEHPPSTWAKAIQGCVSRLRRLLGRAAIETGTAGYVLRLPRDDVDAWHFEALVGRSRELLSLGEAERAAYTVGQALALWRGKPLPELEEWAPGAQESARLEEVRLGAEELQLEALLRAGHHRDVLPQAQRMVEAEPLREGRWSLLARAQYQSGNQAEALRTLRRLRAVLAESLGLDMAPEAAALEQAILRQDPALSVADSSPTASDACPYPGLTPFGEADRELFFGREEEVATCRRRLDAEGVVVVVGPSGCGKSSLVRAGVAASLAREGTPVAVVTPGRRPTDSLTGAVASGRRPVLVVDQAEEVFSVCEDAAERERFLDALVDYAETTPVLVALRADRTGDVSKHPRFARVVERGLFLLQAMSASSLAAAIEGPARLAGLVVEPGLVDLLVREVEGEPGALPLLSHSMRQTWLRREGRTLTVAGYQSSGGVRGAVAQSAEELYAHLPEADRSLLKDLMLRLVAPGDRGEAVRTRLPRAAVVADPVQERLIDRLVTARLVTSDQGVVEIAHESLVRAWPRLRGWLDDDVEGRRILHHLVASASAWDALGRPDSELYRGVRLNQVLAWRDQTNHELTDVEQEFLVAAERAAEAAERSAAERARLQTRMIGRLRITLAGSAVLLVLALVAGFLALRQSEQAARNAAASDAQRVGAQALTIDDIDESMLLAVAGVHLVDSPETRTNLLAALARHPQLVSSLQTAGDDLQQLDISPDGRRAVTYDAHNHLRLYDLRTHDLLGEFQAGRDVPLGWISGNVAFSPDGSTVAAHMSAPTRHPVVLLDGGNLHLLRSLAGPSPRAARWQTQDLSFSADGRSVAATVLQVVSRSTNVQTGPARALVWQVRGADRPTAEIRLADGTSSAVALSPGGERLYTAAPLTIHDLTTGRTRTFPRAPSALRITVSPDGRVLGGAWGHAIQLYDARTGELIRQLPVGGGDGGYLVRFSPDGSRVATKTLSSVEAVVWDVGSGRPVTRLDLDERGDPLDFGTDRSTLYTAGAGGSVREWDLDGGRRFVRQVGTVRGVPEFSGSQVAPGGHTIAYRPGADVRFFDVDSGTLGDPVPRPPGADVGDGSWHPDGTHFALITGRTVEVYDSSRNQGTGEWRSPGPRPQAVDYSTDGSHLAVAFSSGVRLFDADQVSPLGPTVPLDGTVCSISLGPDNHSAIVLTGPPEAAHSFWFAACTGWAHVDLRDGTVLAQGELPLPDTTNVDASPDGRHAAISTRSGQVMVLDLTSGAPVAPPARPTDDYIRVLSYSPDGRLLVSAGTSNTVALWDGRTGRLVSQVTVPKRFLGAGLVDDGHSVVIPLEGGGPVYRWDTRTATATSFACAVAGRDLTPGEWQQTFGERPYEETCPVE